ARAWIDSPLRPKLSESAMKHWDRLVDTWIADETMPLFFRHSRGRRGSVVKHRTGRPLVPCDNSAAHWAFARALADECPTLESIKDQMRNDTIPVAMAFGAEERKLAKYRCSRQPVNLNKRGWKVCHIEPVGIGFKCPPEAIGPSDLERHFRNYISPRNMFLVPLVWAGLGELPEMIAAARSATALERSQAT
ncbi:MAG: hypothetical protein ACOY3P_03230, partial [Planctomycetota bacterium]